MSRNVDVDVGRQQPESPRPKEDVAEWRDREEVERIERQSRSDQDIGKDGILEKGVDAPADDVGRSMEHPPLTDNG